MIRLISILVPLIALTGCFGGPSFMKQSGQAIPGAKGAGTSLTIATSTDESGAEVASLKANSNVTQEIKVSDRSAVAGTIASFPAGTLAIDTDIKIEEAVSVATASVSAELGMGDNIGNFGRAVSVQPTIATDPVQPFTLAIAMPSLGQLALASDSTTLVVIYKVKIVAEDRVVTGIIPRSELEIVGQNVKFAASYFGAFQSAFTKVLVTERKQVASTTPIQTKQEVAVLPPISVTARKPFVVAAGDRVEISGTNFRPTMRLALGGTPVSDLKVASDVSASFIVPKHQGFGLANLTADQDGVAQVVSLLYKGESSDTPVITLAASEVCSGITFYNASGVLSTGEKNCTIPDSCTANSQVGCVTTTTFKAADLANLSASNIKSGTVIAGITGTVTVAPANCTADAAINCVAVAAFKAVDMTNVVASNIKSGTTIAGVAGSVVPSAPVCGTDGADNCVVNGSTYRAASVSGLASKVLSGQTVAGVPGNVSLPTLGAVLSGTNYGPSDALTGTLTLPSPANVAGNTPYGDPNAPLNPSYSADFPSAANVLNTDTVNGVQGTLTLPPGNKVWVANGTYGVGGNGTTPTLSDCAVDGTIGCVTNSGFPAADLNFATPSRIRNGFTIAGITGGYPSATYPLAGADGTTDLIFSTFNAKIKSAGSFEWFDSEGNRYTNNGDSNISAGNISSTVTIFGETGTLNSASDCNNDGQTGCLTTTTYKSVNTSVLTSWDIRHGKSAGGISGNLTFFKNMADTVTPTFDRTNGTGAAVGIDLFDSIDDYNAGGTFPQQNPSGWNQATGANWFRDSSSDNGAGGGTASDGICNGTEDCVYLDKMTGLFWSKDDGNTRYWETAIDYCDGLNTATFGGYGGGWRLPAQKELLQAYTNGIWAKKAAVKLNLASTHYWTSTTQSSSSSYAYAFRLDGSSMTANSKTSGLYNVICVRP